MTRKDGVGEGGMSLSGSECWTGVGDDVTDLLNQPVRVTGLDVEEEAP
jgi:hypothetical protein